MIWLGPMILGLLVVSLIGICVWSMVHAPTKTTQNREARGVRTRQRFDIPGDDVIGAGADPLGWTALDDVQMQRLLNGAS